jgi:hypothetical protein
MKKVMVFGLAAVLVIALVSVSMAVMPCGGMGNVPVDCPLAGNLTPEQAQKFAAFQKEILPLKQQMLQLRTELMTLRAQPTPDWKAIADKQKAMVDVRVEIQKKAAAAGFTGAGIRGGCGAGMCGNGMGMRGASMGMRGAGTGQGMGQANCPLVTPQ